MTRYHTIISVPLSDAGRMLFCAACLLLGIAGSASANCPIPPPSTVTEVLVRPDAEHAAVGLEQCGAFAIGWEEVGVNPHVYRDVLIKYYNPNGTVYAGPYAVSEDQDLGDFIEHRDLSLAVTPLGNCRMAWIGNCRDCRIQSPWELLQRDFLFGAAPLQEGITHSEDPGLLIQQDPSAGQTDYGTARNAWADFSDCSEGFYPLGLVEGPSLSQPTTIRPCVCYPTPPEPPCRTQWLPCMSMTARGEQTHFAVVWADAETNDPDPFFNIALQVYGPDNNLIDQHAGGETGWVNNPALEDGPNPEDLTSQLSPAVSFFGDDIVVCWVGPGLSGCENQSTTRIWARRFKFDSYYGTLRLRDPLPAEHEGWPGMFAVETDSYASLTYDNAHPTVALWQYTEESRLYTAPGRFVIAWNHAGTVTTGHGEVRAQYFDSLGYPEGCEIRVNQAHHESGGNPAYFARLAKSAQHTLVYGFQGQVAAAYTYEKTQQEDPYLDGVYLTILPPEYGRTLPGQCCKGDVNGDALRDGHDIQPFVDLVLEGGPAYCHTPDELCPADMNEDGRVDLDDVPLFVTALLNWGSCQQRGGGGLEDCNANGVADANDIAKQTSQDCNGNLIPDECDIASEASLDVDSDGIPDECEPDCNANGYPDDWDISQQTSADVDSNGVPDECQPDCNKNGIPDYWDVDPNDPDGDQVVWADCNGNGIPDDCEIDCNQNGVPDDCDIDPFDPDGDTVVWADCNANGLPDACDLGWPPPRGSTDCNDNDIPDECDIADCPPENPDCQDCNSNGFPDSCDIAAQISLDEDEDGIPDECEEQMRSGGSELLGDPGSMSAAWTAFNEWAAQQDWGPNSEYTGAEQFQRMVAKLQELGLPVRNPWLRVPSVPQE